MAIRGNGWRHGEAHNRTVEYGVWQRMIQRCHNPNAIEYPGYGARGISVCERWRGSYVAFLDDMGRRPSRRHQIDRIDNDLGYEPGNCRWVTATQNLANRRPHQRNPLGVKGVMRLGQRFRARVMKDHRNIHLGVFDTIEEAADAYDKAAIELFGEFALTNEKLRARQ